MRTTGVFGFAAIGLLATSCTSQTDTPEVYLLDANGRSALIAFAFLDEHHADDFLKQGKFYVGIGPCDARENIRYYPAEAKRSSISERTIAFDVLLDEPNSAPQLISQCAYAKTTGYFGPRLETSFRRIQTEINMRE